MDDTTAIPPDGSGGPLPRGGLRALRRSVFVRMRDDLRLAIVTLYTLCVASAVGPFAVYRLFSGSMLVGLVDGLIVAAFVALAAMAWRPGRTQIAANITAGVAAAAVVAVVLALGLSPVWMFSTLVGNFLMAERRVAIGVNAVMIGAIGATPAISDSLTEHVTLMVVAVITSLFSLIFAARVQSQHRQLSRLAERDGLTGAFNRRSLDHDLSQLVAASARQAEPQSLALIDLDDFKAINDSLGHEAGDRILVRLARVVAASTREKDRFYRYGGEEFVLLLPSTPLDGAAQALEKLRLAHAGRDDEGPARARFSAGVAERREGESAEAWLARADRALLEAKRHGKNRVEVAP